MGINRKKVRSAAQKYVRKGSWKKAIREYRKLVDDDPTDVRSRLKLADLFTRTDETQKALDAYKNAGDQHASQDFYQKAVAVYKQAIRLEPDSPELHRKVGDCYHRLDRLKDAAHAFRKAQKCYKEAGNRAAQIEILEQLIHLDPEDVGLHIQLAENYAKESRRDDALETFRTAGEMLQEEGRTDDYSQVAERILYFDPDDLGVRKRAIDIYLQRDDQKRALKHLQVCFNNNPDDVETLRKLSETFMRLDRPDKAVLVFHQLGKVFREQDRLDSAKQVWKRILEIDPQNKNARAMLRKHGGGERQNRRQQQQNRRQSQRPGSSRESGSLPAFDNDQEDTGPSTLDDIEFLDEEPAQTGPATPPPQQGRQGGDSETSGELVGFGQETFDDLSDLDLSKLDELPGSDGDAPDASGGGQRVRDEQQPPAGGADDQGDAPVVDLSDSIQPVEAEPVEPADDDQDDELEEMVNEADVFIKYGLHDNAREVIQKILAKHPEHIGAFEKRRQLYAALDNPRAEATTLIRLAEMCQAQPDRARNYLQQALDLGVADDHVFEAADDLGLSLQRPESAPTDDFGHAGGLGESTEATSEPSEPDEIDDLEIEPLAPDETQPPAAEQTQPPEQTRDEPEEQLVELDPDEVEVMEIDPEADDDGIMEIDPESSGVMELDPDEVEFIEGDEEEADAAPDEPVASAGPAEDFGDTDVLSGGQDIISESEIVADEGGDFDADELEAFDDLSELGEGLGEATDPSLGPVDSGFPGSGDAAENPMAQTEMGDDFGFTDQEVEGALDGLFESFAEEGSEEVNLGSDDPSGELAEIDFFIQQELYDEAIEALQEFEEANPGHEGIDKRYYQIKTARQGGQVEANPSGARSLSTEFEPVEPSEEVADDTPFDATADVMNTNLELGVAYRDMGLYDDAIDEFRQALDDPDAAAEAKFEIALCKAEKGQTGEAANELHQLLESDELPGELQSEARDKLDELGAQPL